VSAPRSAGVSVPLFSLRSRRDCGVGEFDDLAPFLDWAVRAGQSVVALLPLGEVAPGENSPYNALSSFALDPLYLAPESIEELAEASIDRPTFASSPLADRERARRWKEPWLDEAFRRFQALPADRPRRRSFERLRARASWLSDYALFRALLDEQGGRAWSDWPQPLRDRDPQALAEARRRLAARIERCEYLQLAAGDAWTAARAAARSRGVALIGDLPFAPAENSADVWANRELFDLARSAGAPPDEFSATGQRWGLPMYRWSELRRTDWGWLRERARRMAELYDLFRIDHVVGLFRTYAFAGDLAQGFDPADEREQIGQGRDVLAAVLEAASPADVVAEDLGVIPEFVTATLAALDVPGYRVLRWSRVGGRLVDPLEYPECSIATTGTHDSEPLACWWDDLAEEDRRALLRVVGLPDGLVAGERSAEIRRAILERLYASPSRFVILPIQDLFGWRERINVPATVGGRNWLYRLPMPIEEMAVDASLAAETAVVRRLIDAAGRLRKIDESPAPPAR
jgi:4-alpha-glucanotransferase